MSTLRELAQAAGYGLFKFIDNGTTRQVSGYIPADAAPAGYSHASTYDGGLELLDQGGFEEWITDSTLEAYADKAKATIDAMASAVRGRFISGGIGQDAVYQHKEAQARAYIEAGYPANVEDFPFVAAEWGSWEGSKTPTECADLIVGLADQWIFVAAFIEGEKVKGKNRIRAASTKAEVRQHEAAALAALDAIGTP